MDLAEECRVAVAHPDDGKKENDMTAEAMVKTLEQTLGTNLKTVILYGSAVTNDQTKKFSNINLLVVVETVTADILRSLVVPIKSWRQNGHPIPQIFTEKTMKGASDVFPLEFLDIQLSHHVLFGNDPFVGLQINPVHLKHQLEFELRGKLLQLEQRYLELEGQPKQVIELLARSLSTFTALFKGILMLMKEQVPTQKKEVWARLYNHVPIDQEVLQTLWNIRQGDLSEKNANADELFSRLTLSLEMAIRFVDQFK